MWASTSRADSRTSTSGPSMLTLRKSTVSSPSPRTMSSTPSGALGPAMCVSALISRRPAADTFRQGGRGDPAPDVRVGPALGLRPSPLDEGVRLGQSYESRVVAHVRKGSRAWASSQAGTSGS